MPGVGVPGRVVQGRSVDRMITISYLPPCLLLLGVVIKYNALSVRPRILASFAAFTVIMFGLPLVRAVGVGDQCAAASQSCAAYTP